MAKKSYNYAQLEAVAQEMRANPDMVFYYEYQQPIGVMVGGPTLDLAKEFGEVRTSGIGWPIDEAWIAGAAIGAAAAGSKAIARMPSMAYLWAIENVFNQAGKLRAMTGGQCNMPFVLWVDGAGRSPGSAGQHTDVGCETMFAQCPGVKVVAPSNAYDAKGLLISAIRDPDPVVYMDYGAVKSGPQPDVPDEAYEVPLGEAVVRQPGRDVTIVAWAPASVEVNKALPILAKQGISAEFVDPRSLKPLDVKTLAASAAKTRRLLVVEHGHYTAGFGAHVFAEILQAVPGVKGKRLAFPDVPGPGARAMMNYLRPDAENIVDAVEQLVGG
jgi:pyruvate/2-oxoglutarate/acetoin dehydrogenase E1 component